MNRQTYTALDASIYDQLVNKVVLHAAGEKSDGLFRDPEQLGMNACNVALELTADGNSEFVSKEEDKKKGLSEDNMKKVVTLNINKKLSSQLYDKIKNLHILLKLFKSNFIFFHFQS